MRRLHPRRGLVPGLVALLVLVPAGCTASDAGEPALPADTLSRSQQDSIIGTLPIPGADALGRARDAADAAAERARAIDGDPQG